LFQISAPNEVRIIVRVKDVNDNAPRFVINGRPIVAAIPTTATYGYQIVKLQVNLIIYIYIYISVSKRFSMLFDT
jgi:hypothetical protein